MENDAPESPNESCSAGRCGSEAVELHTQAAERQSSVRHAHFAGNAADGHLLEQHLLQLGLERKVEVARDFERLRGSRRLGGRLGSSFPAGGFFVGRHGVHDLVQVEQVGFHVKAPGELVAPQQVADIPRKLAVGRKVALTHGHAELAQRHRRRGDRSRGTADMHRGQAGHGEAEFLDDERPRGADLPVTGLLDIGHAPRNLHVGANQSAQGYILTERVNLFHRPQVYPSVGRGAEYRIADQVRRIERCRKRVSRHAEREFRKVYLGLVHDAAGVGYPYGDIDSVDRLGQRRILENAVAHLSLEFEGRERRPAHLATGPQRHRKFAGGGQVAEIAGIECRDKRKHVLELHLVASGRNIHSHGIVLHFGPAVERKLDRIEAQTVP